MKYRITGKNVTVTDAMKERTEKKLSKLERYFIFDEDTVAKVEARVYPNSQKIEVTIPARAGILRAEAVCDDYYSALDIAVDKLEDQVRKQKTRLEKRHRASISDNFAMMSAEEEPEIDIRTKRISPDEMDLDDAILAMELLGHDFYIYTDSETKQHAVVYKRRSGGYGLIEID